MATTLAPAVVEDVWACCDNCDKWRRLPPGTQLDEKNQWFCKFSPDPLRNTCDAPEENYDKEAESSVYFEAGQVVKTVNPTTPPPALPVKQQLKDASGRGRSGSPAVPGSKRTGVIKQRRSGHDAWRHQDAADAGGPSGQGLGKVGKAHSGFQKVIQKGGVWEISKGRGRATAPPPHWLWDGLASFAPEAAQLANEGVDIATAASYFRGMQPNGEACADATLDASQLAMTAAAAMAAAQTGQLLESDRSARAASSAAAAQLAGAGSQQPQPQPQQQQYQQYQQHQHQQQQYQQPQQQFSAQPPAGEANAAALAALSAQLAGLPQGLAPPWPAQPGLQPGLQPQQWQLPPASLAQMAAAIATSTPGQMQSGQPQQYSQMQLLPPLEQLLHAQQGSADGLPQGSAAGGALAMQPMPGPLPSLGSGMAGAAAPFRLPQASGASAPWQGPGAGAAALSAALHSALASGPLASAPLGMSAPPLQQAPSPDKQGVSGPVNGRTPLAGP